MNPGLTLQEAEDKYLELSSRGLHLDLTRGRPHIEQLNLSNDLENSLSGEYLYQGIDTRNYGDESLVSRFALGQVMIFQLCAGHLT